MRAAECAGLGMHLAVEILRACPVAMAGEDHLGVTGGEGTAGLRGARLEDHRPALRRPGGPDGTLDVEVPAVVVGDANAADIVEDARGTVLDDGLLTPAVPQLGHHVDRLLGDAVALVVVDHTAGAEVVRGGLGEAGHEIPAGPAPAEVVQRKQLSRQVIRVSQGRRSGDHQADPLGDRGQRRGRGQGFEVLGRLVRPGGRRTVVEPVGEEHRVEGPGLRGLRVLDQPPPHTGRAVVHLRVPPRARRPGVAERQQVQFTGHKGRP